MLHRVQWSDQVSLPLKRWTRQMFMLVILSFSEVNLIENTMYEIVYNFILPIVVHKIL